MRHRHAKPAQRFDERERLLEEQVRTFALERRVLLLLNDEHDVAGDGPGGFVRLALEHDLLVVHHAFFDVHLENFLLLDHLRAAALPALVLLGDDLPAALALVTHGLHLLHHPGRDLTNDDAHAAAFARPAVPARAGFASFAVALGAQHVLRERELLRDAVVQILEVDLQRVDDVLALPLSLPAPAAAAAAERVPAAAEHRLEDVKRRSAAAAAAIVLSLREAAVPGRRD
mmetsp:Transcript_47717/g.114620  ORF Transcript_47717/g.114620 Transcript_47717/m.114620 type:complete len:230 (+) Transcript_47717:573-1262(+)